MKKQFVPFAVLLMGLYGGFAHAQPPPPPVPSTAISSCVELQSINSNLSGNYYLANDIDCAGFDFGDGKGFMPIGNATTAFTGAFNGKGFTISNVSINRPSDDLVGIFGFAGSLDGSASATISHVSATGLNITGHAVVGGLFGRISYGSADDVHTDGTVNGFNGVGGLGGDNRYSTLTNASSSGSLNGNYSGSTSEISYGGLIGRNVGQISCSSSSVNVIGNYRVGGLVGTNITGADNTLRATISSSFATGTVKGFYRVGGLVGDNISATISDTFASGAVEGAHEVAGLVGLQYADGTYSNGSNPVIRNSYATGRATGGVNTNGVLGLLMDGTCADNYWDVTTSGVFTDGCGSGGRTTAEMQTQSTFVGWDFGTTWTMNGYPELQCGSTPSVKYTVTPSAGAGGSISPDTPQTVNQGATTSFTVLADSGYKIDTVEGCGGTLSGNTYTTASVTEDCAVTASFMPHASRNGMTWGVNKYGADLDITRVHCYGQVGLNRGPCNPYQGDTSCSAALPVLCVKVDGRPRPPYALVVCSTCAMNDEYYNGWAEGSIGLTAPVQGNAFATLADADAYCAAQLGEGYRVAEHHDGRWVSGMDENNFYGDTWPENTSAGGWGLYGPGQLADNSRFWVDINDQDANCWGSTTSTRSLSVNSSGATSVAITGNPSVYSGATNYIQPGIPSETVITLTAPAESGSMVFSSWNGCDSTDAPARTCTVTMSEDKAVTAIFQPKTYTVTPSAGAGGSISPDSPQSVEHGATVDFTVTPDTGYIIDTVSGCGGTLSGSTYTTAPVTADCAVTATFVSSITYTVTPRAGHHGSLSPSTSQQVRQGTTTSFTVTPQSGYAIRSVSGCSGSLSGNTYTTGAITKNCAVIASFKKLRKYFVVPTAGRHGSISPARMQRVLQGDTVSFTVTPKLGYAIRSVSGCGGSLSGNTYTTGAITRNCWVRAAFMR